MQHEVAQSLLDGETVKIRADASPREAAERMADHGVGCLVVVDADDHPLGMLTDRDLTLRVLARELDPDSITIAEVMSTPLVSIDPGVGLDELLKTMIEHAIRRVPLMRDGRLVGLLSFDDVLRGLGQELNDLGAETVSMLTHARSQRALARLGQEIEDKLRDVHGRLERTTWYAREGLLRQVDELREGLRKAIQRSGEV